MDAFGIDEVQAEYVAEIKLRHLNREYLLKQTKNISDLEKAIKDLTVIIENPGKQKKRIAQELARIAETYGQPRKTVIVSQEKLPESSSALMISDYNLKVFLSRDGYLKKIPLTSLRGNFEHKMKPKDCLIQEIDGENREELILFSNRQKAYKIKLYELEDSKASDLGYYLPNLVSMEPDEKVIYMVPTTDYSGMMFFAFRNGKAAKVPLSAYETKTNRKVLANAYGDPELRDIRFLPEDSLLIAVSNINKVLLFDTTQVSLKTTRSAKGVQVMRPKKGSELAAILKPEEVVFKRPAYYQASIPAVGTYLKKSDQLTRQDACLEVENVSILELVEPSAE
jgi:DNA gyrase subunit A